VARIAFLLTILAVPIASSTGGSGSADIMSTGLISYDEEEVKMKYCINVHGARWTTVWRQQDYMEKLRDTGAEWVRISLTATQTSGECVAIHKDYGLKVLGIICQQTVENLESLEHWRTVVGQTLDIHGDLLDAVECWNEPDLPEFFSGIFQGQPDMYVQMLQILREELDARNLNIPIVAGAVCSLQSTKTSPDGGGYGGYFLRRIRELGSDQYCDVYSVHSYKETIGVYGNLAGHYARAKELLGTDKPIWYDEMGNGDSQQASANYMSQWFTELLNLGVPFVSWYLFWGQGNYGMVNDDFSPRPSYTMFQSFTSQ